jgi:branched-chain amino acid transport system ATP-binding protein
VPPEAGAPPGRAMSLAVDSLDAGYGAVQVLRGVTLAVCPGEVLALMGRNGAGKSTTCKAIMGLVRAAAGTVTLDGARLDALPAHEVPRRGVAWVPQGRRLFAELTVAENLEIGLMTRKHGSATRDRALALFPRLRERLGQASGTLSGGEQQMLAIARALCTEPKVLLLDEPTEGLQPSMIALIRDTVLALKSHGVATILVEQRVDAALAIADRIAFMANGRTAETLPAAGLTADAAAFRTYVGV